MQTLLTRPVTRLVVGKFSIPPVLEYGYGTMVCEAAEQSRETNGVLSAPISIPTLFGTFFLRYINLRKSAPHPQSIDIIGAGTFDLDSDINVDVEVYFDLTPIAREGYIIFASH